MNQWRCTKRRLPSSLPHRKGFVRCVTAHYHHTMDWPAVRAAAPCTSWRTAGSGYRLAPNTPRHALTLVSSGSVGSRLVPSYASKTWTSLRRCGAVCRVAAVLRCTDALFLSKPKERVADLVLGNATGREVGY